jgi:hypothetical protein
MNPSLVERMYDLSHSCGFNQRYFFQMMQDALSEANRLGYWLAGITLIGFVASAISFLYKPELKLTRRAGFVSFVFALLATALAMFLKLHPIADQVQHYSELYVRWSDFRTEVDTLKLEVDASENPATPDSETRYRELFVKKNELIGMEKYPVNEALKEKCWQDENETRTGFRTTDPDEKPRTGAEFDLDGKPKSK